MKSYGIKNKDTGLWFAGFGPAPLYPVIWSDEHNAQADASLLNTRTQAQLLCIAGERAQIKPVAVSS